MAQFIFHQCTMTSNTVWYAFHMQRVQRAQVLTILCIVLAVDVSEPGLLAHLCRGASHCSILGSTTGLNSSDISRDITFSVFVEVVYTSSSDAHPDCFIFTESHRFLGLHAFTSFIPYSAYLPRSRGDSYPLLVCFGMIRWSQQTAAYLPSLLSLRLSLFDLRLTPLRRYLNDLPLLQTITHYIIVAMAVPTCPRH